MIQKFLITAGGLALTAMGGVAFGIAFILCILVPVWIACQLDSWIGTTATVIVCGAVITLSNPRFKHWDFFTRMVAAFAGCVIILVLVSLGAPVMRSWGLLF